MSIGKCHSAGNKPVDIGRFCLWVPSQMTDPVIQIIDGDEENIGFLTCNYLTPEAC